MPLETVKGQQSIHKLAENAATLGLTPKQLEQLLSGVELETGFLGRTTPDAVRQAFSGAAQELAAQLEPKTKESSPREISDARLAGMKSAGDVLAAFKELFVDKKPLGGPLSTETIGHDLAVLAKEGMSRLGQADTIAAAKGMMDALLAGIPKQADGRHLPVPFYEITNFLDGLQHTCGQHRVGSGHELADKATVVCNALLEPDVREPNGKIAERSASGGRINYLDNHLIWGGS